MLGIATMHYFATLADSKKGSLTNRHQCGAEHFKNDVKYGYLAAAPVAAAVVGCKTPKVTTTIAKTLGTGITKVLKAIADLTKSGAAKDFVAKMAKKPGVLGLGALGVLGVMTTLTAMVKHANKKGRINQKYEDAAKIESQTKNVVLDAENKKVDAKQNYAEMCA